MPMRLPCLSSKKSSRSYASPRCPTTRTARTRRQPPGEIFKPGSRKDVKPRAGAFLLAELDPDGSDQDAFDQQFYFSPIKGGKLSFRFLAAWKAHGELNLGADGTATGFINQKSHITELRCKIHSK